jgi:hypothetical protein
MEMSEPSDFPVTRRTIDRLDAWVNALASPLLPLQQVSAGPRNPDRFRWTFGENTERALVVDKAVLMASGIRAAMTLADMGHVTECGTILRTVSDFAVEIFSVSEGMTGAPTNDQQLFVRQYYMPMSTDPDEYAAQDKERYVTRGKLLNAHLRFAEKIRNGADAQRVKKVMTFLGYGYDKYVHGAQIASLELYYGDTRRFMVRGVPAEEHRNISKRAVASKLHEALASLIMVAVGMNMPALVKEIEAASIELYESGELS